MAARVTRTSSRVRVSALVALVLVLTACSQQAKPQATHTTGPQTLTGSIGPAAYDIQVPAQWNGTLFLYSHGYVAPILAHVTPFRTRVEGAFLLYRYMSIYR